MDGFTGFDCKLSIKGREEIVLMMARILLKQLVAIDSIERGTFWRNDNKITFGNAEMGFPRIFKRRSPTAFYIKKFSLKLFMRRDMRTTLLNVDGNNTFYFVLKWNQNLPKLF